ncbi:hypothetical protein LPC_2584 [Legionella pneumophila str. Corby]|nr:hypothetical protein LPC_2584 [Legionella pneumophila str. Corby]
MSTQKRLQRGNNTKETGYARGLLKGELDV